MPYMETESLGNSEYYWGESPYSMADTYVNGFTRPTTPRSTTRQLKMPKPRCPSRGRQKQRHMGFQQTIKHHCLGPCCFAVVFSVLILVDHFHCMVFGQNPIQGKYFNFIVGDETFTIVKTAVYSRWHTYRSMDPENYSLQKHLTFDSYDYGQQGRYGSFLNFNDLVNKTCDWHDVLHKEVKMLVDIFLQHPILMITLLVFLIFNRYIVDDRLCDRERIEKRRLKNPYTKWKYRQPKQYKDKETQISANKKLKLPRCHKKPKNTTTRDTTDSVLPSQKLFKWKKVDPEYNSLNTGYTNDGLYQHNYAALLDAKQKVAKSVGIVHRGDTLFGTGFLVGNNKVFTSYHLVERMLHLGKKISSINKLKEHIVRDIGLCGISFNYFLPFGEQRKQYNFKSVVHFVNPAAGMDYIILEIDYCWGLNKTPPSALSSFGEFNTPVLSIYGHPAGGPMVIDPAVMPVYISKEQAKEYHKKFEQAFTVTGFSSQEPIDPPYEGIEHTSLTSYFYKSFLGQGSSGGPGVVFDGNRAAVVLVMQGIYPNFYNDKSIFTVNIEKMVSQDAVFNYGTQMKAIFLDLKLKKLQLCCEIFKKYPKQWDDDI